jgi:hypothetical protein
MSAASAAARPAHPAFEALSRTLPAGVGSSRPRVLPPWGAADEADEVGASSSAEVLVVAQTDGDAAMGRSAEMELARQGSLEQCLGSRGRKAGALQPVHAELSGSALPGRMHALQQACLVS